MKHRIGMAALAALLAQSPAWAHGDMKHGAPAAKPAAAPGQQDWGIAGEAKAAKRTIQITMTDNMRFSPDRIEVNEGEMVKFVIRNAGKMLHEMVIGTKKELDAHAEMMKKHPGMEHDEPWMAHVDAGKTATLVWRFNRAGEFRYACLLPGHYEAGMVGTIVVKPRPQSKLNSAPKPNPLNPRSSS
jgi:uncharacterized cupredoxin-like copper-binding protein